MEHPHVYKLTVAENTTCEELSSYIDKLCKGKDVIPFIRNHFDEGHSPLAKEYVAVVTSRVVTLLEDAIRRKSLLLTSIERLKLANRDAPSVAHDPSKIVLTIPRGITDRIVRKIIVRTIGKFHGYGLLNENQYILTLRKGQAVIKCFVKENPDDDFRKHVKDFQRTTLQAVCMTRYLLNYFQWYRHNPQSGEEEFLFGGCHFADLPIPSATLTPPLTP